jgi:hypothetical protein
MPTHTPTQNQKKKPRAHGGKRRQAVHNGRKQGDSSEHPENAPQPKDRLARYLAIYEAQRRLEDDHDEDDLR